MTRIHAPSRRAAYLALSLGLLAAIAIAIASVFLSHAHAEKKRTVKFDWMKPVPSDKELRSRLTEEQYHVTRESGTETLFRNLYWDNKRPGIYVDIITGEPLFSSVDKFDSGLGLPSFTKPISPEHVVEKSDTSHDMVRTELRASRSNSHLGHLFADGPPPTGRRYSVNSVALRFLPVQKLEEEGYGDYLPPLSSAGSPSPAAETRK